MGADFKTDTTQLKQFVKALKQAVEDLESARTALSHVRASEIGTPRLDEACDDFQERWKYGSGQLSEMIGSISEGVDANAASYEAMEENLRKSLQKMTNQCTTGGSGEGK